MTVAKRNGFTLVESLMAVLMFVMSGLAFSSFVSISVSHQSQNKTKLSVTQARAQILGLIGNRSVWMKNLALAGVSPHPVYTDKILNPELACLRDGTMCTEKDAGYDLTLTDQNGNIIVDAIDTTKGLTKDGAVCSGFSTVAANISCPWRMSLKWKPACAVGGACQHPQVMIEVSVTASAEFLQSNNLTNTQVSLMLEQPKTVPPFAKKISMLTNSVHYGYPTSIEVDPTPFVVTDSPGKLTFSIPKTTSVMGGTVGMNGQKLTYTPAYNISPTPAEQIYGTDWFLYKIKDSYTGMETMATVYVSVMTPYTWTGLASGGDKSISNKKNFCGKVVNGQCDGSTFPVAFLNIAPDSNLVFNETCTNCDVDIGTTTKVASLETTPYFQGTITQKADVEAGNYGTSSYGWSTWRRAASFRFTSGTWDGQAGSLVIPHQGEKFVCSGCSTDLNSFFRIEGGTFKAPPVTHVIGSVYIPSAAAFKHNNGTFYWTGNLVGGISQCVGGCYIGSDSTTFWNLYVGLPMSSPTETSTIINGQTLNYGYWRRTFLSNGLVVANDLTVAHTPGSEALLATYNGSAVALYGNLILPTNNHGGDYSYGSAGIINLVGTRDQTIFGQVLSEAEKQDTKWTRANFCPGLVVNKTAGKLTIKDTVTLYGGLVLKGAGSYDIQSANLILPGGTWGDSAYSKRRMDLQGRTVSGLYFLGARVYFDSDLTANDMFYYSADVGYPALDNGDATMRNIHIKGNAVFGPNAKFSADQASVALSLLFDGTGNQNVTSSMAVTGAIGNNMIVNKPSGTITFDGNLGVLQNFLLQAGTVVFGPTFGISNVFTGADDSHTRIQLNDPVNQRISKIDSSRTIEALTPLYVDDMKISSVGGAASTYSNLYGGPTSSPIYVAKDLTFALHPAYPTPSLAGSRVGTQLLILNGTANQNVSILGAGVTGTRSELDLQVQKVSGTVNMMGNGPIGKLTIASGSVVNLDAASPLTSLNATVSGILNKNGTTPLGTQTISGGGVINN